MSEFRAGAASLPLEPPLGLPMVGFIRQPTNSGGYGLPLEVGALALERDGTRVVLCGVDIVGIIDPQIEPLIDRVAAATGADPAGILLNWSHTHLAPPGGSRERRRVRRRRRRGRGIDRGVLARHPRQDRHRLPDGRRAARAGRRRLGTGRDRPGRQPARAHRGRLQRRLDPRLEPGRARRQPGHRAAGAPSGRVGDLHARRLRLPPGHDRLRHDHLLGRLPRADARCRPVGLGRRVRLLPGLPEATCSRSSPSPTPRTRHGAWGRGSASRRSTRLPTASAARSRSRRRSRDR